jgi:hypothetical protein
LNLKYILIIIYMLFFTFLTEAIRYRTLWEYFILIFFAALMGFSLPLHPAAARHGSHWNVVCLCRKDTPQSSQAGSCSMPRTIPGNVIFALSYEDSYGNGTGIRMGICIACRRYISLSYGNSDRHLICSKSYGNSYGKLYRFVNCRL